MKRKNDDKPKLTTYDQVKKSSCDSDVEFLTTVGAIMLTFIILFVFSLAVSPNYYPVKNKLVNKTEQKELNIKQISIIEDFSLNE